MLLRRVDRYGIGVCARSSSAIFHCGLLDMSEDLPPTSTPMRTFFAVSLAILMVNHSQFKAGS